MTVHRNKRVIDEKMKDRIVTAFLAGTETTDLVLRFRMERDKLKKIIEERGHKFDRRKLEQQAYKPNGWRRA